MTGHRPTENAQIGSFWVDLEGPDVTLSWSLSGGEAHTVYFTPEQARTLAWNLIHAARAAEAFTVRSKNVLGEAERIVDEQEAHL